MGAAAFARSDRTGRALFLPYRASQTIELRKRGPVGWVRRLRCMSTNTGSAGANPPQASVAPGGLRRLFRKARPVLRDSSARAQARVAGSGEVIGDGTMGERASRQRIAVAALVAVIAGAGSAHGESAGTIEEFILFQGSIKQSGAPVTAECDFLFTLFDGSTPTNFFDIFSSEPGGEPPVVVTNGLFQVPLDFGRAFESGGGPYSVEVAVRCPAGSAAPMETLSPRAPIEPVPYAYRAKEVDNLSVHALDAVDVFPKNAVYVDEVGYVGIGTTSPSSDLHIVKDTDTVRFRMKAGASWTATLEQTNSSILSLSNGGSKRMVIEPGGDVGIGTENASARLDVVGGNDPQLEVRTNDTLGDDAGIIIQGARNASTSTDVAYLDLRDFDSDEGSGTEFSMAKIGAGMDGTTGERGWLRFSTNGGGGAAERMRIDSDGNVGIGTSSPTAKLDVNGDLHVRGDIAQSMRTCTRRYLPMDFQPTSSGKSYSIGFELKVPLSAAGQFSEFVTHVRLPDGARLTALRASVDDSSATNEFAVELWSGFEFDDRIVRLATVAIPGLTTLSANLNHAFDPTVFAAGYRVEVSWTRPASGFGDIKFRWVELEYETDQACLPR